MKKKFVERAKKLLKLKKGIPHTKKKLRTLQTIFAICLIIGGNITRNYIKMIE